jgi:hypothetical protein
MGAEISHRPGYPNSKLEVGGELQLRTAIATRFANYAACDPRSLVREAGSRNTASRKLWQSSFE